ncbi:MAG: sialidase, partial [Verrucomicrobiota bacterium]|nr:sialidase [Verrucomicrobiota bacterium]
MRTTYFAFLLSLGLATGAFAQQAPYNSATISGLGARNIGSAAMSGRVSAVAASHEPDGKTTIFVGAASGGVWKSEDFGTTFRPVFDEQPVQSIGAIALDPKNSKNVWVGSGESWTRNSVSIGNGVYRSTDGGESWTRVGLPNSERVAKLLVSPENSETVYAAVPGALWSDSPDRGLYKTTDGGLTWTLILKGGNLSTGCSTVAVDPSNPNVLLAGMWDFRRKGWTFRSGGDGPDAPSASGLFRSTDAGATWNEITPENSQGFPTKPYGRIAVAYAPSNAKRVYAFVEGVDSALFVSDDGGATWAKRDKSTWMVWRPFYFANLVVDPKNPDRVFKTDGALIVSDDAGKSFATVGGFQGAHGDVHDVWIDPVDPMTVIAGDDGGTWY